MVRDGVVRFNNEDFSVEPGLVGQRITLRLDGHLMHAISSWDSFLNDYPHLRSWRADTAFATLRAKYSGTSENPTVRALSQRVAIVVTVGYAKGVIARLVESRRKDRRRLLRLFVFRGCRIVPGGEAGHC